MKTKAFKVTVQEISLKTIVVEANSANEALKIAKDSYNSGRFELDWSDFDRTDFSCESDGQELPDKCPHCGKVHEYSEGIEFIGMDGFCMDCNGQIVE